MEARATQSVVYVVGAGGTPRSTQALALAVAAGGVTRATQSLAYVVEGTDTPARVTQSLVYVVAPPVSPSRATQSVVLPVATTAGVARSTQSLVLTVSEHPSPARATQSVVLVPGEGESQARVTQSVVLAVGDHRSPSRVTQSLLYIAGTASPSALVTQSLAYVVGDLAPELAARVTQSVAYLVGRSPCDGCGLTLSDLVTRTLGLLGEDTAFPVYWSAGEVTRMLNDAYIALCRETGAYEASFSDTTVVGQAEYALDPSVVRVIRVFADQTPLRQVTKLEMDRTGAWESREGAVWAYTQTVSDPLVLRLIEIPTTEQALEIWATATPEPLALRCDEPVLPAWSRDALAYGAAARALRVRGERRSPGLSGAYSAIYGLYRDGLKTLVEARP